MLNQQAAAQASRFLSGYSKEKGIYMKINYFNADHTHALIDLPTSKCVEDVIQLFKGGSSFWINDQKLLKNRFAWGKGYGAFSVSHSDVARVANYIARQAEHHKRRAWVDEYELFVKRYGLEWRDEENR
jgi:REP element-mobilizing transposase RayT